MPTMKGIIEGGGNTEMNKKYALLYRADSLAWEQTCM